MNPGEQDSTLLSGRDAVLCLWYYDTALRKKRKRNSDIAWENKNENNSNDNENPIILALVIG